MTEPSFDRVSYYATAFLASTFLLVALQLWTARTTTVRGPRPGRVGGESSNDDDEKSTTSRRRKIERMHLPRRIQHASTGLVLLMLSIAIPPRPHGVAMLLTAAALVGLVHLRRTYDEDFDRSYLEKFGSLLRPHEVGAWEDREDIGRGQSSNGSTRPRRRRVVPPSLPGAFHFLLGVGLAASIYDERASRAALLALSLADPAAAVAGIWFDGGPAWSDATGFFSGMGCRRRWRRGPVAETGRGRPGVTEDATAANDGREPDGNKRCDNAPASGALAEKTMDRSRGPTIVGSVACAVVAAACVYSSLCLSAPTMTSSSTMVEPFLWSRCLLVGIGTAAAEVLAGRWGIFKNADDNLILPLVTGGLVQWLCLTDSRWNE